MNLMSRLDLKLFSWFLQIRRARYPPSWNSCEEDAKAHKMFPIASVSCSPHHNHHLSLSLRTCATKRIYARAPAYAGESTLPDAIYLPRPHSSFYIFPFTMIAPMQAFAAYAVMLAASGTLSTVMAQSSSELETPIITTSLTTYVRFSCCSLEMD